jgi:ketosteroid isomerase-like protein
MPHEEGHIGKRASDANLAILQKAYDAFASGDLQAGADMLTDDVEWHEIGRAEPIRGKAALAERYQQPDAQAWSITGEKHDMLANEEHGVSLITATATKASGESLTYKVAEIYHFRDGKISARWAFSDDTEAINRFFGGA